MVYTALILSAFAAIAAAIPQQAEHIWKAQLSRMNQVFARDDIVSDLAGRGISMDGSCGSVSGLTCGAGNCCSSLGWCGATPLHCGTGCQSTFGECGEASTSAFPAPAAPTAEAELSTAPVVAPVVAPAAPVEPVVAPVPSPVVSPDVAASPVASPVAQNSPAAAPQEQPAAPAAPPAAPTADSNAPQHTQSSQTQSGVTSAGLGNVYKQYSGDGSMAAGWPSQDSWVDFETAFANNKADMTSSCRAYGDTDDNTSESEAQEIHDDILAAASSSGVDARYILAILMQESGGCVRARTTNYGVRNPGLMQSFNGQGTCHEGGIIQTPCPASEIAQMINDGVSGTGEGSNSLSSALAREPGSDASRYYRAARIYNSGSIDPSGSLQAGYATHCYSSDIANRLTGWVMDKKSPCTFDPAPA